MVSSKVLVAKRALVKLLLTLAAAYSIVLKVNRDAADADVAKAYRRVIFGIKIWHNPARSPDLNPVELFWAWLRKKLRAMDLKDAVAKRPVLSKMAYTQRVRCVLKTKKAQTTAANIALRLKKNCKMIVAGGGAAIKG